MLDFVDFFRFTDNTEDVFLEGENRYLYVCAEPFDRAYMLASNEYRRLCGLEPGDANPQTWNFVRYDTAGASVEYLQTLTPAPVDVARAVIMCETRRALQFEDMTQTERAAYLETKSDALEFDAHWVEVYA